MQKLNKNFKGKDILAVGQFTIEDIDIVFEQADYMEKIVADKGSTDALKGKILANLFYEASTRTSSSFAAAIQRLGGGFIPINDVKYSSVIKGENLTDTIRTLQSYADVIALRHPVVGSAEEAAAAADVPIVNAGDGIGEHPTQALLDLYTIKKECGRLNGLTITMVGDLKYGRTVHSLAEIISPYDVKLNYVAPNELQMPTTLQKQLADVLVQEQYESIDGVINKTDVLYATRIQKERFEDSSEYDRLKNLFRIDPSIMRKAPKNTIVMHPLPRVNEISQEVDADPRAAYFRQMRNGLYVRMALLSLILGS